MQPSGEAWSIERRRREERQLDECLALHDGQRAPRLRAAMCESESETARAGAKSTYERLIHYVLITTTGSLAQRGFFLYLTKLTFFCLGAMSVNREKNKLRGKKRA